MKVGDVLYYRSWTGHYWASQEVVVKYIDPNGSRARVVPVEYYVEVPTVQLSTQAHVCDGEPHFNLFAVE